MHEQVERVKRGRRRGFVWSEQNIIRALDRWHAVHLKAPTANMWLRAGPQHPATHTVVKRFGSWNAALRAAGLRPRPRGGSRPGEFRGALREYRPENRHGDRVSEELRRERLEDRGRGVDFSDATRQHIPTSSCRYNGRTEGEQVCPTLR